jgi:hypothetical protein
MRPPKTIKLWQLILGGPFLLWAGWDTYKDVSALEEHGGSMWVGRTTKFMYDVGGKWGVLLGTWALAALYFYILWLVIKRDREEKAALAAESPAPKKAAPKPAAAKPMAAPRPSQPIQRPVAPIAPPPAPPIAPPTGVTRPGSEPQFLV